jgi:uncharacterized protein YukE
MLTKAANLALEKKGTIDSDGNSTIAGVEAAAKLFQGRAGTAFLNVAHELHGELVQLLAALQQMADNVHASNTKYATTDDASSSDINAVAGQAPSTGGVLGALRA